MRHYECQCLECEQKRQIIFQSEPYPVYGESLLHFCSQCGKITAHTRVLTKKTMTELRQKEQEKILRDAITEKCEEYGFRCTFFLQSVLIQTEVSKWQFDYHRSKITLYHESTVKVNFGTGNTAFMHIQFQDRKVKPLEVIEYIEKHDRRKKVFRNRKKTS